jgi:hypothetical protein
MFCVDMYEDKKEMTLSEVILSDKAMFHMLGIVEGLNS